MDQITIAILVIGAISILVVASYVLGRIYNVSVTSEKDLAKVEDGTSNTTEKKPVKEAGPSNTTEK